MLMNYRILSIIFLFLGIIAIAYKSQNTYQSILSKEITIQYNDSSFKASTSWLFNKEKMCLTSPEQDLTIYLIQMPYIQNFEQLASDAWKKVNPNFNLKILQSTKNIAQGGWEKIYEIQYDTPANENRLVYAGIKTFQGIAYIHLVDGAAACYPRRCGQIEQIITSWRPHNLKSEDLSNKTAKTFTAKEANELRAFIKDSMHQLDIPGLAIAIVQNNAIVFSEGFGVIKKGSGTPVTSQSLFMIGSITKPLTTLMMSKLIDLEKIRWDTPVAKALPSFTSTNKIFAKKLLMKHTVSASTGMPRRDAVIMLNPAQSGEEAIEQMATLEPTTGFGETYQYSNDLVALGGFAAANMYKNSGTLLEKYQETMEELVFNPLNMLHTFTYPNQESIAQMVYPHVSNFKGQNVTMYQSENNFAYPYAPAMSICSNVEDMARYLQLELNKGLNKQGERIISEKEIMKRRSPATKITDDYSYGLGFFISKKRGLTLIGHEGVMVGFSTDLFFLPKHNLGVVILTNTSPVNNGIQEKIFELLFDAQELSHEIVTHEVEKKQQSLHTLHNHISTYTAWIQEYVGSYYNKDLGTFTILKSNKGFELQMNNQTKALLGSKKQSDGSLLLSLISGPHIGHDIQVQKEPVKKISFNFGNIEYEFREASTQNA